MSRPVQIYSLGPAPPGSSWTGFLLEEKERPREVPRSLTTALLLLHTCANTHTCAHTPTPSHTHTHTHIGNNVGCCRTSPLVLQFLSIQALGCVCCIQTETLSVGVVVVVWCFLGGGLAHLSLGLASVHRDPLPRCLLSCFKNPVLEVEKRAGILEKGSCRQSFHRGVMILSIIHSIFGPFSSSQPQCFIQQKALPLFRLWLLSYCHTAKVVQSKVLCFIYLYWPYVHMCIHMCMCVYVCTQEKQSRVSKQNSLDTSGPLFWSPTTGSPAATACLTGLIMPLYCHMHEGFPPWCSPCHHTPDKVFYALSSLTTWPGIISTDLVDQAVITNYIERN